MSRRRCPSRAGLYGLLLLAAGSAAGCGVLRLTTLGPEAPAPREAITDLPNKVQLRVSQYVFFADFEVRRGLPLFQDLSHLRDQVYKELHLPTSTSLVQVYLFESKERYERFMQVHFPELPKRRAFFVADQRLGGTKDLRVYTYWGENISQDLRHELTHALLHSVLQDVPLWLDEGLAEYFELPAAYGGVNLKHLEQLEHGPAGPFRPDLARLEQLTDVPQMTQDAYREAWAWVHLMLRGSAEGRRVLIGYLGELRSNGRPGPLRPRLLAVLPTADAVLTQHLANLERQKTQPATVQR
jgi:hypothetical protein